MVGSEPSCMQREPSPSRTITRRSGQPRARPSPSVDAPPMKPTQETERSSGAMSRQPGAVVMVWMQMALPRAAAMTRSTSSGFMGSPSGLGNSEGGFAPLPNLPPGTGCAGGAGARTGTSTGGAISRGHAAFYSDSLLARREADEDGGGTAALPAQAV